MFWILAPVAVLGALGMVLVAARPCTARCCSPLTMICLAVLYIAQDAPFLGVVQVVVYTGAVMMLFLFVLMLVGVDSADSLVETLRGQRVAASSPALGFGVLLVIGARRRRGRRPTSGLDAAQRRRRQRRRASPT